MIFGKKKMTDTVRCCPKCRSVNVSLDWGNQMVAASLMSNYVCNKCGHEGPVFPIIDKEELEEKKK